MNPDRLHHVALGIVGLALGTNGAVAVSATGGSDLGGAVTLVGAACLVGLSAHGLVSGADRTVDERRTERCECKPPDKERDSEKQCL